MGLDACVMCNCLDQGLDIPAAFKPHTVVDRTEPPFVWLGLEYRGHEALFARFDAWYAEACPHPGRAIASERISNWGGVRSFQTLLTELDPAHYHSLIEVFPSANGGFVPSADVAELLGLLQDLAQCTSYGERYGLFDAETDQHLFDYIPAYQGVFRWLGPNLRQGVDLDGFFIALDDQIVFRSKDFLQGYRTGRVNRGKLIGLQCVSDLIRKGLPGLTAWFGKLIDSERQYWIQDLATAETIESTVGSTFESAEPILIQYDVWDADFKSHRVCTPGHLQCRFYQIDQQSFDPLIISLKQVCEASLATGNPLCWC
ncbi:MAG: hypothetical protein CVV27_13745 [Candidatus Melainabacteria bacterium HGW-Melainabacteria-1]|nr:MAG: hypothetical protein CVV27_13745 [Candidatus Melainabacteria bacterium HGW-Melainabacteria-1]